MRYFYCYNNNNSYNGVVTINGWLWSYCFLWFFQLNDSKRWDFSSWNEITSTALLKKITRYGHWIRPSKYTFSNEAWKIISNYGSTNVSSLFAHYQHKVSQYTITIKIGFYFCLAIVRWPNLHLSGNFWTRFERRSSFMVVINMTKLFPGIIVSERDSSPSDGPYARLPITATKTGNFNVMLKLIITEIDSQEDNFQYHISNHELEK